MACTKTVSPCWAAGASVAIDRDLKPLQTPGLSIHVAWWPGLPGPNEASEIEDS